MKIGLVLERFDPKKGGLEHWTWQFAHRLIALGHEVHVVAFEFAEPAAGTRLVFHRLAPSSSRLERAAVIEEKLRILKLDVIHDMGCGWYADLFHPHGGSTLALWEHNLKRIPRWRQIRFWREKRYRELAKIEKRQHASSKSLIVAVSQMVRNHFSTLHGVPPGRMRLIYNGVDPEKFSPENNRELRGPTRFKLGCRNGEILFLLVAHNLLLKNAEAAIRAISRLIAVGAGVRLAIVGGKRQTRFIRLAAKLGVSSQVDFIESVSDVRPYYAAADVYLHPTWYDPCSLVALEAFACGLPVITSRFNGVSEMMTDGTHGFILDDPADIDALAGQMRLLLDPEVRKQMGESARRLALEWTLDRQTAEFLALYHEISRV
ncbi:MAG: glycosyltransferase family 4 protein [Verrucomicrobiota bacterium]